MRSERITNIHEKLDSITRRWWFYLVFAVVQFIVPPYVSKGYDWSKSGEVLGNVFSHALIESWQAVYPVFKVIPIILVFLIFFLKNKVARIFSGYVAISYILFAILQNIAITEEYGLAISTGNVLMFLIVAVSWIWEVITQENLFLARKRPIWKYWVIPLAFLAFWYPLNPQSMQPDFNPLYILTSPAGLAFCLMTPTYLSILILHFPTINTVTLRMTSLVGTIIALYNMWLNFLSKPDLLWWNGILHIPLLVISIYSLVLSIRSKSHIY